jgi:hypothetical protein
MQLKMNEIEDLKWAPVKNEINNLKHQLMHNIIKSDITGFTNSGSRNIG